LPRAASLAAEIENKFGIQPQLIRGRGGVFEIIIANDLIFSKKKQGRFPLPGEVETELAKRLSA
jgi:selT/selW/selH-like putative selenoprotein